MCVCVCAALGQVMLYVDGMNGVMEHKPTVQWLYSLVASKYRLVVKTALKLLLVFVEYTESNALVLVDAINTMDASRGNYVCVCVCEWGFNQVQIRGPIRYVFTFIMHCKFNLRYLFRSDHLRNCWYLFIYLLIHFFHHIYIFFAIITSLFFQSIRIFLFAFFCYKFFGIFSHLTFFAISLYIHKNWL